MIWARALEQNLILLDFSRWFEFQSFFFFRKNKFSNSALEKIVKTLFEIVEIFRNPRTTNDEFLALKATILINSIPSSNDVTSSLHFLTNQIYRSFRFAAERNSKENHNRQMLLLLQLPHIRILSSTLIGIFWKMRSKNFLPQADLLLEMLDAQQSPEIQFKPIQWTTNSEIDEENLVSIENKEKRSNWNFSSSVSNFFLFKKERSAFSDRIRY